MPANLTLNGARISGPRKIPAALIERLGGQATFADAVVAYQQAKAAHAQTEGVPAPIAHPLVVEVVNRYGGEFEIEPEPPPQPEHRPLDPKDKDRLDRADADIPVLRAQIEALEKSLFLLRDEGHQRGLEFDGKLAALEARIAALPPPS